MLEINNLEIIRDKRVILSIPNLYIENSTINGLQASENCGKTILTRTLHGLYSNFRGKVNFLYANKKQITTYLISNKIYLLQGKSVTKNIDFVAKKRLKDISSYMSFAQLEGDFDKKIKILSPSKQKLLELAIACGVNPQLLIIDDFDKTFSGQSLMIAGQMLTKFKDKGGSVLLTSTLNIPDMDSNFLINSRKVVSK